MRVVIDTNVLVSAALRDRNPEAVILFVVGHPAMEWLVSPDIMAEYLDVLARPKLKLLETHRQEWLNLLRESKGKGERPWTNALPWCRTLPNNR